MTLTNNEQIATCRLFISLSCTDSQIKYVILCRFTVVEVRDTYWADQRTDTVIAEGKMNVVSLSGTIVNTGIQLFFLTGDSGAFKLASKLCAWKFNWSF